MNHEHNDAIKLESMYFWTDGALVAETMLLMREIDPVRGGLKLLFCFVNDIVEFVRDRKRDVQPRFPFVLLLDFTWKIG